MLLGYSTSAELLFPMFLLMSKREIPVEGRGELNKSRLMLKLKQRSQ
jgi:hypothetical protein